MNVAQGPGGAGPPAPPALVLPGVLSNGVQILQNQTSKNGAVRTNRLLDLLRGNNFAANFNIWHVLDEIHSAGPGQVAAHNVAINIIERYVYERRAINDAVVRDNLQGCQRMRAHAHGNAAQPVVAAAFGAPHLDEIPIVNTGVGLDEGKVRVFIAKAFLSYARTQDRVFREDEVSTAYPVAEFVSDLIPVEYHEPATTTDAQILQFFTIGSRKSRLLLNARNSIWLYNLRDKIPAAVGGQVVNLDPFTEQEVLQILWYINNNPALDGVLSSEAKRLLITLVATVCKRGTISNSKLKTAIRQSAKELGYDDLQVQKSEMDRVWTNYL